jgi:Stress responsive A/B Barrel Domain
MFFDVVMMRLAGADEACLARIRHYAERVRRELPYVRDYHFGRNIASRGKELTWSVIGIFDSSADHDRYQASALHQEMKAFMTPHIADIVVCDCDASGET